MYRALQIANYVVHVALTNGLKITNLHLQKILYYLQAVSLVYTGRLLFSGVIEKWPLGPVVPDVYHEYKEYGSQPIKAIAREYVFNFDTMEIDTVDFDENTIRHEDRRTIEPLILQLLTLDPFELVNKTHEHSIWSDYKEKIENGSKGLCYTNEEIHEYFVKHPEKLKEVLGELQLDGRNSEGNFEF